MTVDAATRRRTLLLLVVLTLVWGTNWPLFPLVLREVSVWTFRSVSMTGAALLLLAVARLRGQSLVIERRHWKAVALAALCNLVVWNLASALAAVLIPSGQAAVLGFTMPVWAALIGWAVLGEQLSWRRWAAVALAGAGVALLARASWAAYAQAPLGLALGLLSAVSWAVGTLILKRARIAAPATVLSGWQLLLASLPVTAGALVLAPASPQWPPLTTIALIAYITIVPMGVGNVAWFSIVNLLPASLAGLSSILVPVVAMLAGAMAHGEPLGPVQLVAMGCCAAALALALGPAPATPKR